MFSTLLTIWYALTALAGSQLCCWVCCEPAPVGAVALTAPASPVEKKICSHCCEAEDSSPALPLDSTPLNPPQKPSCPYCAEQIAASQAIVSASTTAMSDSLKDAANQLTAELPPQRPTFDLAILCDRESEPLEPYPSSYQLVNVFHMMRC